ncbi:MAG: ATP-binding protein, partial [Deltaproteobacteria bacterium]|nr:ATP-binding protein [Deltaproteobacteria bacterium]
MIFEKWLPVGFDLPDGSKIKSLLSAKGNWQLFTTSGPNKLLVAENKLAKKWIELGLIEDSVLWKISIGKKQF